MWRLRPGLKNRGWFGVRLRRAEAARCHDSTEAVPRTGSPRKLNGLCSIPAAWSPDGTRLACVSGNTLYVADRDGNNPRPRLTLPGGQVDSIDHGAVSQRLWQVELDGSIPRRLLSGWTRGKADWEGSGRWTANGEFFVFAAVHEGNPGLWAIRERPAFFGHAGVAPIHLTSSLEEVTCPVLSPDGKRVFAIVNSQRRGELERYNQTIQQFVAWPRAGGLSAGQVAFSPDGQRAAYIAYPEMTLWTMNIDGTERRQLADNAALPQWSPDGRRIGYMHWKTGEIGPTKIRVIAAEGGLLEEPVTWPGWQGAPAWTPDGKGLIFGENAGVYPMPASCRLHRFDLNTRKTEDLAGTTGLWTPRMCPAGRYVAAETLDQHKLVLYDLQTARRTDLITSSDSILGDNPTWSKDGRFIYIDAPLLQAPVIYRIHVAGRRSERIASLEGIQRANNGMGAWIGLTPDDSPLILRQVQGSEIYAWDWIAP